MQAEASCAGFPEEDGPWHRGRVGRRVQTVLGTQHFVGVRSQREKQVGILNKKKKNGWCK